MKIFILKLLSLIVLFLGLVSLGIALGLPQVQEYMDRVPELLTGLQEKLPEELAFLKGALTVQGLWFGGSVTAIVLGIYGFFPQLAKYRRKKKIAYTGPHGEVQIQLDTVEHSLNHVLARMPEVKKINLRVDPQDGGRKALIRADVILYQQPGQNARAIAALVSDYIAETATKLLGLEELATIDLNVTGICVNTRKSSKAIRKESLSHSGNAPVELLEAAPAPLTLSGPDAPLGSASIEEELEEEAESAMEAVAVDTRRDVANQAAARSELLEPLSVGEPSYRHASTEAEAEPDSASASPDEAEVAPLDMDGLDENLDDQDEETDDGDDEELGVDEVSDEDAAEDAEGADAHVDSDAAEPETTFGPTGSVVESATDAPAEEGGTLKDEAPLAYPWEQPAPDSAAHEAPVDSAVNDDTPVADADQDDAEVPETAEFHTTDSVMGDVPGEVTIPEADETEAADTEAADTEVADTEVADTKVADTEAADTEAADTEAADTEAADAEANADADGSDADKVEAEAGEPEAGTPAAPTEKKRWGSWFN